MMKKQTRLLLAAMATGLAFTTAGVALADGPRHGGRAAHGMFADLELTDQQREQIRTIVQGHRAQAQADRERMRAAIREVLTDEQAAQLDAKRAEHAERGERRHRRHRGGHSGV